MEKIIIKISVDGEQLHPITMGAGKQDINYEDDIAFFSIGHAYNKEKSKAPYEYMIRLTRHKTEEEKRA